MKRKWAGAAAAAALNLACGQQVACVARGARVATSKGPRRIEELRIGDELIAVDPKTGAPVSTRLTAVRGATRECGALCVGSTTLTVTTDHPLYDPQARGFFPAGDWLLGRRTQLLAFDGLGCAVVHVDTRHTFAGVHDVFDLTVESELHTFVAEGFVVHNKQPPACTVPNSTLMVPINQDGEACTCGDGGMGVWRCESPGGDAVCAKCGGM